MQHCCTYNKRSNNPPPSAPSPTTNASLKYFFEVHEGKMIRGFTIYALTTHSRRLYKCLHYIILILNDDSYIYFLIYINDWLIICVPISPYNKLQGGAGTWAFSLIVYILFVVYRQWMFQIYYSIMSRRRRHRLNDRDPSNWMKNINWLISLIDFRLLNGALDCLINIYNSFVYNAVDRLFYVCF